MLNPATYDYIQPSQEQIDKMLTLRQAARIYSDVLEQVLPEGPDRTHTLRLLRTTAMWANIAVTRQPDGTPR